MNIFWTIMYTINIMEKKQKFSKPSMNRLLLLCEVEIDIRS